MPRTNINRSYSRASTSPPSRLRRRICAAVEALEMRLVLSTFVVNTFVDQTDPPTSTTVSLRDAIARAAANIIRMGASAEKFRRKALTVHRRTHYGDAAAFAK